ncbi:PREDICTED: uncharacterized protein LOC106745261 [Dinoponera quadriceps]|uniref:Uncharacterized protein LOC106745261 n=1 Tax=Dinoponera quadriceps TaxID=609295 RepID=A0A6P3XEB1_DINQU|nr:PREDICTED: uncharacterized protein LOC106745261 [Dinoponera quadriceps]
MVRSSLGLYSLNTTNTRASLSGLYRDRVKLVEKPFQFRLRELSLHTYEHLYRVTREEEENKAISRRSCAYAMARPLIMAICVLVAFALPRLTYGRAAIEQSGSASNTLLAHDSKPKDFQDHEQEKAIVTSLASGGASIPVKSRQKRLSDQRIAELETLITLSLLSGMLSEERYKKLDLLTIDRRRRATTRLLFPGPSDIPHSHLAN